MDKPTKEEFVVKEFLESSEMYQYIRTANNTKVVVRTNQEIIDRLLPTDTCPAEPDS